MSQVFGDYHYKRTPRVISRWSSLEKSRCSMAMGAEHWSKCAVFHRQWLLLHISVKLSKGTKKTPNKQTKYCKYIYNEYFNCCLRIVTAVMQIKQRVSMLDEKNITIWYFNLITLSLIFSDNTQSLLEENRQLKDLMICKICMENEASIAMLPCGHLCCCTDCAPAMRKCPICRQFVKGTVRTWLAWLYLFIINFLEMVFLFVL